VRPDAMMLTRPGHWRGWRAHDIRRPAAGHSARSAVYHATAVRRCGRCRGPTGRWRGGLRRGSAGSSAGTALAAFASRRGRSAACIPIAVGGCRRVGTTGVARVASFVVQRSFAVWRRLVDDFRARAAERAWSATAP
jgi:hypothetical protein